MAADAAVSLGVVVARRHPHHRLDWLDPVVSLVILALILIGTSQLFREAFDLAMDAVPAGIDPRAVHDYLAALPGVIEVHDLHIWGMSTTEAALTAHLVKPDPSTDDALIAQITHDLQTRFRIGHPTIQWERPGQPPVVPHRSIRCTQKQLYTTAHANTIAVGHIVLTRKGRGMTSHPKHTANARTLLSLTCLVFTLAAASCQSPQSPRPRRTIRYDGLGPIPIASPGRAGINS